jgi:hypothetical protein
MGDLLNWIARNGTVSLVLGIFLLAALYELRLLVGRLFDFLVESAQAFTGKYPPPEPPDPPDNRPIVRCNGDCACNKPCKCCQENECQVGCECASHVEE